jgi:DNA helicase II / ATP-dependent DNA helicase PcrA
VDAFDGLNPEQRRAVEEVRGPVCILAGAGSGKTTTITRRIAHQVASRTFAASEILAVTFTDKAAGELRARLQTLGISGVRASTFHAAALGQLRHFSPDAVGRILPSKALMLRKIANALPAPFKFRPAGDLATEIEWAKNRRIRADDYRAALGEHEPPIPEDLMERVYRSYERLKQGEHLTDFEDLLELAVQLFESGEQARATFRERYRAFTVDEFQDVNLLQRTLLDLWLGARDDLCVVGDDYQSIYAFTGAGPEHLLGTPGRFPHATVVTLEANYRSSPQILALANRLVPRLGGAPKTLRATRGDGLEPLVRPFASAGAETSWLVDAVRAAHSQGVPYEEMAVLARTNGRLADFEEAFHEEKIPFQGSSLLDREAARSLLRRLRGPVSSSDVPRLAREAGWLEDPPEKLGEREQTRQTDLARLVRLADEFGEAPAGEFVAELERRFGSTGDERRGVNLLTYHRAKGLEFEAVFLPRLEEKELPSKLARTAAEVDEERRLLYVGMTRAKSRLALTWSRRPSRFLAELGSELAEPGPQRREAGRPEPDDPLYAALKTWRLARARADDVPAYVVFHNATLEEIAARRPRSMVELASVPGVGPTKLERYGEDLLAALTAA